MVRLADHPDMTLDVYRGRKTTMQQTLSGWGKVGKNDAKFQIHEPFELESLFFIGILKTMF